MSVTTVRSNRRGRPGGRRCFCWYCWYCLFAITLLDVLLQPGHVERPRDLEGPWERLAPDGEVETLGRRVQVRPTAGCPTIGIREDHQVAWSSGHRHPQQVSRAGSFPAPDTGALPELLRARVCSFCHSSSGCGDDSVDRPRDQSTFLSSPVTSVSGRMSIRQPVSRAARRAFCPSLPIASES